MLYKRFLRQLYKSFKSTGGYLIGTFGSVCSILSVIFKDQIGIDPPYIIIGIGTIFVILVITFFDLALYFYNETLNNSPEVYTVLTRGESTILLTEYSDLLQVQGLVTVYLLRNDFEELVGYGEVINIQNDRKIQIDLKKRVLEGINIEEDRKSLIIKPFVTFKTIEE